MINYIALLVALALSVVSAYYSIYGLTTLFSSAFWPVVLMGSVLELGKLVTASWLYHNWDKSPRALKYYLTLSVLVLMFISSMGIFGFLSRAHIDQSLAINTGSIQQIKIIESSIEFEKNTIKDLDTQISQIDSAISKINEKGKGTDALKAATSQRKTRNELVETKKTHTDKIAELTKEKIKLESVQKKMEAEVGPLKYVADLIYGQSNEEQLEKAVRWVILILIFVFDPLAVLLLIAANNGLMNKKVGRPIGSRNRIRREVRDRLLLKKQERLFKNKNVTKF
jgi:hypothetical protein